MPEELVAGREFEMQREVTSANTADNFANPGVPVFATPALVGLLEETAIGCVAAAPLTNVTVTGPDAGSDDALIIDGITSPPARGRATSASASLQRASWASWRSSPATRESVTPTPPTTWP